MRPIDGDALYEQTAEWENRALNAVMKTKNDDDKTEWQKWSTILAERSAFKFDVADAPTVDAVEVVRCRECKHWGTPIGLHFCPMTDIYTDGDWFCAYGERREEDDDDSRT